MAEEKKPIVKEKEIKETKSVTKPKVESTKKAEVKPEEKNVEDKKDVKIDDKKQTKKEILKKDKAVARGNALRISPKYSKFVCRLIKRKSPEKAVELLEKVVLGKLAVKMPSLELPHQKGKGVAGARYPKTVAQEFIKVVKQLNANCIVNNIDEPVIIIAMSNRAAAPFRRGRRKAKRTNLYLEAVSKTKLVKKK